MVARWSACVALAVVVSPVWLAAQPFLGPEVVSDAISGSIDPAGPFSVVPQIAMAKGDAGVGIVWSASNEAFRSRLYFARLDASNHVAGEVHPLPVFSESANAGFASIAADPSGEGFLASWLEWSVVAPRTFADVVVARIADDGTITLPRKIWGFPEVVATTIRSDFEAGTWLTAGTLLFHIAADGTSVADAIHLANPGADLVIADGRPQVVSIGARLIRESSFVCPDQPCGPHQLCNMCCSTLWEPNLDLLSLQVSYISAPLVERRYEITEVCANPRNPPRSVTNALPAVASNGQGMLLVWTEPPQDAVSRILAVAIGLPATNASFRDAVADARTIGRASVFGRMARASVASDGRRTVVVWETWTDRALHDVVGVVIERDGTMMPITIASSVADERAPVITATGVGSFLVAYEKLSSGERRLAGRTITFPARRRATR